MNDNFSLCIDCPVPCKTCYLAKNTSCISLNESSNVTNITNETGCRFYIDTITNKCVRNCSSDNKSPNFVNGTLLCSPSSSNNDEFVRIDSAIYTHLDGTKHVFFILDQ